MLYATDTCKDVATATRDLEEAVMRHKFGVLHVHDLQQTLKRRTWIFRTSVGSWKRATPSEPPRC